MPRTAPVRYGVVGLGYIAQVAVLPAFAHARNSRVTALVTGNAHKRETLGAKYDVAHRFGYDELEACFQHVDALYICTPNAQFASSFTMRATPGGIRTRRETGGGSVYDLGIYCLNAARMLFDTEPTAVSAFSIPGARSEMPEVDDTTSAVLRFDGDRLATFTSGFAAADVSTYRIVGTEGQIVVDPAYEYAAPLAYTMTVGDIVTKSRGRKHDQFAAEIAYFSDCIRSGRRPEPSAEEGAWDVRVINAIYEAAASGARIGLPRASEPGPDPSQAMALPPVRRPRLVDATPPHGE